MEDIPFINNILPQLWIFSVVLIVAYVPISIIIGHWHRKTQLKIEMDVKYKENPFLAKMFRTWLDDETNKIDKDELEKFVKRLKDIENNK